MVKEPKEKSERFRQLQSSIDFWNKQIVLNKQMQKDMIKYRNFDRRKLKELEKKWDGQ
jgi:hypothetical protein